MLLTNLSFEEWIEHAFSREVHIQQAAWYFDPNHDLWDPKPVEAVAYLARRFEDPERTLSWFSPLALRHGSPGRRPRPMRKGDRQALRSTVRSALHASSLARQ